VAEKLNFPSAVLIANRGEIAIRIARTCRAMGIRSIAVHSVADRQSPHVPAADEAVELTGQMPTAGYLDGGQIIAAAERAGADAIHPGYGFLSENAAFARACVDAGLTFVGPSADVIAALGDKIQAKAIAAAAGVPTVPGVIDDDEAGSERDAKLMAQAEALVFPLLVKASAGGGGRGMRIVEDIASLPRALKQARREAKAAFDSDRLLLERYIANPRHVEVQVFGDRHGGAVHLFERDCSVQRRHQKIVEEAPAPGLRPETRSALYAAALALVRATRYDNAGTVEFILDAETQEFYFLEVNTRLQVEHPVTEAILGIDLVDWQIRVAAGQQLPLEQEALAPSGCAIEVRVAAEDASNKFIPQTGTIAHVIPPAGDGIRFDSGIGGGYTVTPYYDSMLAKVIAHGADRATAIRRLERALAAASIMGLTTNIPFLRDVLAHEDFAEGRHTTHLVSAMMTARAGDEEDRSGGNRRLDVAAAVLTAVEAHGGESSSSPWSSLGGWRGGCQSPWRARTAVTVSDEAGVRHAFWVTMGAGVAELAALDDDAGEPWRLSFDWSGERLVLRDDGRGVSYAVHWQRRPGGGTAIHVDGGRGARRFVHDVGLAGWKRDQADSATDDTRVLAPGPGLVATVNVAVGQKVVAGEALVVIESMKMLQTLTAPRDGDIAQVRCAEGQAIVKGDLLVELEPVIAEEGGQ
jgi:3-methylcrotonyl-CoA carboxylase alpha subunit